MLSLFVRGQSCAFLSLAKEGGGGSRKIGPLYRACFPHLDPPRGLIGLVDDIPEVIPERGFITLDLLDPLGDVEDDACEARPREIDLLVVGYLADGANCFLLGLV